MKRGEIWWASLPEPSGSEPGYRRPVLIIQADEFNQSRISTTLAAVITSNLNLAMAPGNVLIKARTSGCLETLSSTFHNSSRWTNDSSRRREVLVSLHSFKSSTGLRLVFICGPGLKRWGRTIASCLSAAPSRLRLSGNVRNK
jgi:hypothetical protein